jgi:hypothetical protein
MDRKPFFIAPEKNKVFSSWNKISEKKFFTGPFNPKYKDINLFDTEQIVLPIKEFNELIFKRSIEREKQLKLIQKCKKKELKDIKFYN